MNIFLECFISLLNPGLPQLFFLLGLYVKVSSRFCSCVPGHAHTEGKIVHVYTSIGYKTAVNWKVHVIARK